jgi:hypothetical protein
MTSIVTNCGFIKGMKIKGAIMYNIETSLGHILNRKNDCFEECDIFISIVEVKINNVINIIHLLCVFNDS